MHHRSARAIVTILAVALLATTFGGAAEGKRAADSGLALPPTTIDVVDQRDQWCGNMSHAPELRNAATDLRNLTPADEAAITVLEAASQRPMSLSTARRTGSEYAALSENWSRWEQICTVAHAGRS